MPHALGILSFNCVSPAKKHFPKKLKDLTWFASLRGVLGSVNHIICYQSRKNNKQMLNKKLNTFRLAFIYHI